MKTGKTSQKSGPHKGRGRAGAQADPTEPLEVLASRSKLDRTIVEILATAYHSLTRTELAKCLYRIKARTPDGKRVDTKKLDPLLTSLTDAGLVTYQARVECSELIRERLARQLVAHGRFDRLADAVEHASRVQWENDDWDGAVRSVRRAVYTGRADQVFDLLARCEEQFPGRSALPQFCLPMDQAWLADLDGRLRIEILTQVLGTSALTLAPAADSFDLLDAEFSEGAEATTDQRRVHVEQLLLRGRSADAARFLEDGAHPAEAAWRALILGDHAAAIAGFESVPKPAGCKRRSWVVGGMAGLLHAVALATSEDARHRQRARQLVQTAERDAVSFASGFGVIDDLLAFRRRGIKRHADAVDGGRYLRASRYHSSSRYHDAWTDIERWIGALVDHWVFEEIPEDTAKWLEDAVVRADQAGYTWIAAELAELLARAPRGRRWRARLGSWRKAMGGTTRPLADLLVLKPAWERKLDLLGEISAPAEKPARDAPARSAANSRLVWFVSARHGFLDIEPRTQKRNAKGQWTKGRKVALKRLFERDPELDFLTDQDWRVCATIDREVESSGWGRYTDVYYTLDGIDTYRALAGHPALLRSPADPTPVELVFAEPRLLIDEREGQLRISLHPEQACGEYTIVQDGPYRIEVYVVTEAQQRVAKVLDGEAVVPRSARDRVEAVVAMLAPVITVQSDITPAENAGAGKSVSATDQLKIQLKRLGVGLEVRARAFPLGDGGPACVPGQGQRLVVSTVRGERLQSERDLDREQGHLEAFSAGCPTLERAVSSPATWRFDELDGSLTFLLELAEIQQEGLVIEWSDAERFDVTPELGAESLEFRIRGVADGFSVGGGLRTGTGSVVPVSDLLHLLGDSPARFLALNDGRFLALTDAFHRQLEQMARYVRSGRGQAVQLPALAVPAIEPLVEAAGSTRSDARWKAHVARIRAAASLEFSVPSTLKAELRPYQEDGFRWLARLAAWGAGACLADDMGLGKTVQALAVALLRATEGPTLVVAPTSVCAQWLAEAARFAPTLHARQFGGGDRRSVVTTLGPHDLLVTSYGLLVSEVDLLEGVDWATVILDEAQAIKNPRTKRFKAAVRLRSDFRLATTGTPIENRLEELWSLFGFINPGLLGSRVEFERRFSTPIERQGDRLARTDLRRLVLPFVLRRSKSEVLDELPPRSEIDLQLEMSTAEVALYEALRRQALDELTDAVDRTGAARLQILAWITKLRRACCNPSLVAVDEAAPASCKLAAFKELTEQLRDSGHKALVFSQFVGHLTILREWLDDQNIRYQYLDGSTPTRARTRRVAAFQAGEGELFLISLRAGGLGLNLTAADYVIHMDPWWNPAVEDQATDRAHRIGQTRPVTLYRLIVRNTIEERIVALHRHKRDIADKILEGADVAGRLSSDELLALLRE